MNFEIHVGNPWEAEYAGCLASHRLLCRQGNLWEARHPAYLGQVAQIDFSKLVPLGCFFGVEPLPRSNLF